MGKRYVCPRNGEPTRCETCHDVGPHKREELVSPGDRLPECLTHHCRLILA